MKLLISGEGPRDLGACNNAQDQCTDSDFNPGPMAIWLARLWEALAGYNLLDTPEAVRYVSEHGLAQMAKQLADDHDSPVMAVLFRDADGTRSAPRQMWQSKWDSMADGFASAGFRFGVPMVPKPKSEAWLLCSGQTALHSHAAFEDISGNDSAPNSAKNQWDAFRGRPQNAALEVDWCKELPTDWQNLLTMPSFKAFYERFHEVATAILSPTGSTL